MGLDMTASTEGQSPLPFASLLSVMEAAFVDAGNSLEQGILRVRGLKTTFSDLERHIGAEANDALSGLVSAVADRGQRLQADLAALNATTRDLRAAMVGMRAEVHEMNTTIRLVSNLSVNARIQGSRLSRQRQQIASFLETLGAMAEVSDRLLSGINEAMATIVEALGGIEGALGALDNDMRFTTFPAIAQFTGTASGIGAEQGILRESSARIDERMQQISSDVSRLVVALQVGDTLRQRLEQVHAALMLAGPVPAEQAMAQHLAIALSDGALGDCAPQIDDACVRLDAVRARARDIVEAAADSAFSRDALRRAAGGRNTFAALQQGMSMAREHFGASQAMGRVVLDGLQKIEVGERDLNHVARQLRLAGINAVITCAKLGAEGRGMRELAHWLWSITHEFDATMLRLQARIAAVGRATGDMTDQAIPGLAANLGAFESDASALGDRLEGACQALLSAESHFNGAADELAGNLQSARSALSMVRMRIDSAAPTLERLRAGAAACPMPESGDKGVADYLAAMRRKYTMAAERSLHDQLVAGLSEAPEGGGLSPAMAADPDDLDDILF